MKIRVRLMGRYARGLTEPEMVLGLEEGTTVQQLLVYLKNHLNLPIEMGDDTVVLIDGSAVSNLERAIHDSEGIVILDMISGG